MVSSVFRILFSVFIAAALAAALILFISTTPVCFHAETARQMGHCLASVFGFSFLTVLPAIAIMFHGRCKVGSIAKSALSQTRGNLGGFRFLIVMVAVLCLTVIIMGEGGASSAWSGAELIVLFSATPLLGATLLSYILVEFAHILVLRKRTPRQPC